LIIWEDIFGEINRFTWQERCLIKRYNRIIHENRDAFLSDNPRPLVADLREDLYINSFPSQEKCVYPVFQLGRENVDRHERQRLVGEFLVVDHPQDWHYVDVWNHQPIRAERKDGRTHLSFWEEPADVMSCIVGFPKRLSVRRQGENLLFEVSEPIDGTFVEINLVDNLTMIEKEAVQLQGARGKVVINELGLEFPYLILLKLRRKDVLVDEVIIDLGWKKFNQNWRAL
jgi:hypothetical protein